MSLKEELLNMKDKITKLYKEDNSHTIDIDLKHQVDEFIEWYYENMLKDNYEESVIEFKKKTIRETIEKIAIWYDLRYPSYEINKITRYYIGDENMDISNIMFRENPYIIENLKRISDIKLEWKDFYNAEVFFNSLPYIDKYYFYGPKYPNTIYLNPHTRGPHLDLTKDGKIKMADYFSGYTKFVIKDEELIGLDIREAVKLLKERGITLPENNELEPTIIHADNEIHCKEGILDSAMYRIIERGGGIEGAYRAFLFAKEFNRNINIPMAYGAEYNYPGLLEFIDDYIKAGGTINLACYTNYFQRNNKEEPIKIQSLKEITRSALTREYDSIPYVRRRSYYDLIKAMSIQEYDKSKEEKDNKTIDFS